MHEVTIIFLLYLVAAILGALAIAFPDRHGILTAVAVTLIAAVLTLQAAT